MNEYTYKGFKIKEVVKQKSLIFMDDVKYINCYGVKIEYPNIKKNVMINHEPINILMDISFNKMKNIKPIVEEKIKDFYKVNSKHIVFNNVYDKLKEVQE